MIGHPRIMAMEVASLLICLMVLYSTFHGIRIIRYWNIASGSTLQLELERRTSLISLAVTYFLAMQLISLIIFIDTADSISNLFVGAMCAVGTLTVNDFGYPTLILKIITAILAGLWLILNHTDNKAPDYPLIKVKYIWLVIMAPLVLAETILQTIFFTQLSPDIITSCCGSLFSPSSTRIATEVANAPPVPMLYLFYASNLVTIAAGLLLIYREKGGYLFAFLSGLNAFIAIAGVISVISLYIYEMPSHHCPFCILKSDYVYKGYVLYLCILTAALSGLGTGMLMPFRNISSLCHILPVIRKKLAVLSLLSLAVLILFVTFVVEFTTFTLR